MKLPTRDSRSSLGFNMTPMIDVVFLLIIFFLVSSHLAKQESQLELDLPEAESGLAGDGAELTRVTVNVLQDGSLTLAGKQVAEVDLASRLQRKREQEGGQLEVRIRGDRTVAFHNVAPILTACTEAGIWNVNFAIYPAKSEGAIP